MNNGAMIWDRSSDATRYSLRQIVQRYGTPTYAFDVQRLRSQVEKLRAALPAGSDLLYSLKANASLGICDVFADCGIGADVASAGELATALEAGFPAESIFVAGPFKLPETIDRLRGLPQATLSVDSLSELESLAQAGLSNPVLLRLRPDFVSCAVVPAGCESRFGLTQDDVRRCGEYLPAGNLEVIGFHVFAGSQVLDADKLCGHLRHALDLSLRAADTMGITPHRINLGGGFGVPTSLEHDELNLSRVAEELARLSERAAPARLVLELGRYLIAEAGFYLTSVLAHQTFQGRLAVVVDGGVHQRADMCGSCLRTRGIPPIPLTASSDFLRPTDVLGCLSLPDDVLIEAAPLPELKPGDVLAFVNAGAYGLWSSPALFHGSSLPAEVAFDGSAIHLMRGRQPAHSILKDQQHVIASRKSVPA